MGEESGIVAKPRKRRGKAVAGGFARGKTEVSKLHKLLDKVTEEALEKLITIMRESKDDKVVAAAVKELLTMKLALAKFENEDKLQRQILDIKLLDKKPLGYIELEGDKPSRPRIDFNNIQDVS